MKRGVLFLGFLFAGLAFFQVVRAMTSTNYLVNWDSVNSGGTDESTSTNFLVRDTFGEQAIGISTSTNYGIRAGYRLADDEATAITFEIGTQEDATVVSYTAFSTTTKSVTVSSAAGLAVGNFIGVVENRGLSQVIAVGKISSIIGLIVTVDAWDGDPNNLSLVPAGGDDVVYRMEGSAAQLGALSTTAGSTSLTYTSVISNVTGGYTVYINADGYLRVSSTVFILGVADGAVTIGSEEYGGRVFGTYASGTGSDFAITTSTRAIQQSSTFANDDRVAVVYKASIGPTTAAGNYTQLVYYTLTPNY